MDKVAEDGTASFAFTHASEYVIVLGEKDKPAQPESGSTEDAAEIKENNMAIQKSPKTGQERKNLSSVAVSVIILAGAAIAAMLAQRKKKR